MREVNGKGKDRLGKHGASEAHLPPETRYYGPEEDEIDLFELIRGLWRQKWVVVLTMAVFVIGAVVYLIKATPLYEITMQVRPGVTAYDNEGKEIRGWAVNDIVTFVKNGQYRPFLPEDLISGKKTIPTIEAKTTRRGNLATLLLYHPDPRKGEEVLSTLHSNLMAYYVDRGGDPQVALTKKGLSNRIKSLEDKLKRLRLVERVKIDMAIQALKEKAKMYSKKQDVFKKNRVGQRT